jgi:hypothetical protein
MPDKREELILSALRELDRLSTTLRYIEHYKKESMQKVEKIGKMLEELNEK